MEIGLGHYKRCIELESALGSNVNTLFLTFSKRVVELNVCIETIKVNKKYGVDEKIDKIKNIVSERNIDVVICDINNKNALNNKNAYVEFIEGLSYLGPLIVSFEDFIINNERSDLVIVPYSGADELDVKGRNNKYLLGLKYFVARGEFLKYGAKKINNIAKNIFISMGGADVNNLTGDIVSALCGMSNSMHLNIVKGPFSQFDYFSIADLIGDSGVTFEIHESPIYMSKIMHESDLGIVSSGLTQYETSIMGLPAVVISLDDYHKKIVDKFSDNNSVISFGVYNNNNKEVLRLLLGKVIKDKQLRMSMSVNGRAVLDGNGANRIIGEINNIMNEEF